MGKETPKKTDQENTLQKTAVQRKTVQKITMPIITLVLTLLVWELCVRWFNISLYVLHAPSKIILAIIENTEVIWMHSLVTLK